MSLKGIIQFVIRIQSYYIIEYPQQGLFSFHITVYQTQGKKRVYSHLYQNYAIPYQIIANPRKSRQNGSRIIEQPYINDQIFVSSTGLAKYSQETIEMDDWIQLRLQIEGYPQLYCQDIYMQIQFRFNDKSLKDPQREGQLMEVNTFKLNDIQNGLFNFCQCGMKSPYSSKLNFYVMGFITTFKFAKYEPLQQQLSNFQKKRVKAVRVEDLIAIAKLQYPNQNIQELFYTNYVKKLRIGQYLIAQRFNSLRKNKAEVIIKVNQQFATINNYELIRQKQFKQYLDKFFPKDLTISMIFKQINEIRQQNFTFIQSTLKEWIDQRITQLECKKQYQIFEKQHYGERVFKSIIQGKEEIQTKKQLSSKENKKIAKEIRGKNISLNNYAIQNVKYEQQKEKQSIVFYEIIFPFKNQEQKSFLPIPQAQKQIATEGCKFQYSQKHMLVVLCHGFQGSSYDMYLIKRWIMKQIPDAYFLIAKSNQDNTQGDIRVMGKKVAEEIENYISNYMQEYEQENVIINLVGHSMGGIIARAALPHLEKYKHQFGFFCSLSSPHLGYLNGVSGLIKVGLWAIRRWKKIESLQQLSMQQRGDPRKTYLYQLSKTGHLRYFRKIVLVSSYQDSYVSWNSARISSHRSKNSHAKVQQQMENNILGNNVFGATIHRLDINFNVKTSDLDSFIGRTAHINLIISENLFKILGITVPNLFNLIEFGREGLFL